MTGALLLRLAVEVGRRVLLPVAVWVAVCIGLAAVLGFVTWVGALAMWLVLLVVLVVPAASHDLEVVCGHDRVRSWCGACDVHGGAE